MKKNSHIPRSILWFSGRNSERHWKYASRFTCADKRVLHNDLKKIQTHWSYQECLASHCHHWSEILWGSKSYQYWELYWNYWDPKWILKYLYPTHEALRNPYNYLELLRINFGIRNIEASPKTESLTPFTPKSDQCQISPAASQEIWHHTVWRTWFFIAYSDERWLSNQLSIPHLYISL